MSKVSSVAPANGRIGFFYELPMWLDLDGFRVVHACWDQKSIDLLTELAGGEGYLNPDLLVRASTQGTREYEAIETLLKGHEIGLPEGSGWSEEGVLCKRSRGCLCVWNNG